MPFGNEGIESGVALALSGGGFRATLFHTGTLWRLNELGYLSMLDRISSVSGGSITSGVLGLNWEELDFENGYSKNFKDKIVNPLRDFTSKNIDVFAIGEGALLPWKRISDAVREEYEEHLFGRATLQQLPDRPRFVFNSTNMQTGKSFRFSKPYAGDYRIGLIEKPNFRISLAVTASSAFPPFLSPVVLELEPNAFKPVEGADLWGNEIFCRKLYLSDGGVYDNLGLETAWNRYTTVLVSDAGAPLQLEEKIETAWHSQALRAMDVAIDQSRALRKRALIEDFKNPERKGSYWGIKSNILKYGLNDSLPCNPEQVKKLASIRTRLNAFSEEEQCRLINWGYAVCDAAMRKWVFEGPAPSMPQWPYPNYSLQ